MATKQVNVLNIPVGAGTAVSLSQPVRFDAGKKCPRIRCRVSAVMANASTAYNMTAANCVTLLSAIISNFKLSWGNAEEIAVDSTLPFSMMRLMFAQLEGKDFTVNDIPINTVSGSAVQIAATGTNTTLTFEFLRSFTIKKGLNELHDFCPGTTQMQTITLEITPSSSAAPTFDSTNVTLFNASAVPVAILFEEMPADSDQWANVPIIRQASPSADGQNIALPVGNGGSLIAVADLSHAASGYGLTLFDLDDNSNGQAAYIQGLCTYGQAFSGYLQDLFNGDYDWSGLAAPLYTIPTANDLSHLDTCKSLQFYQPNDDITTPQICVTYVPAQTNNTVTSAGTNIQAQTNGSFLLTNAAGTGSNGKTQTPSQVAAVLPLQIQRSNSPAYALSPGKLFVPGQAPTDQIPGTILGAAQAAANKQPGGNTGAAAASQIAKSTRSIANALPGYASPGKSMAPTNAHLAVASAIIGHGVTTAGAQATAKLPAQSVVNRLLSVV